MLRFFFFNMHFPWPIKSILGYVEPTVETFRDWVFNCSTLTTLSAMVLGGLSELL